jgi:hypothetical protein
VKHFATADFWNILAALPVQVQEQARKSFELLKRDATHPSLHLKRIGRFRSARINLSYRALAVKEGEDLVWFWIGDHKAYERLIKG